MGLQKEETGSQRGIPSASREIKQKSEFWGLTIDDVAGILKRRLDKLCDRGWFEDRRRERFYSTPRTGDYLDALMEAYEERVFLKTYCAPRQGHYTHVS